MYAKMISSGVLLASAACAALAAVAEPSPRVLVDAPSLGVSGRIAKWQQCASGWRLEGRTVSRAFPRAYDGCIRYSGAFRFKGNAWIEFLDPQGGIVRGLWVKGGETFALRGDFRAVEPIASVRVRMSRDEDLCDVVVEPLRVTVGYAFDESFGTYKDGAAPRPQDGWRATNAVVRNIPYLRNWHWSGEKGYDKTMPDHVLAVAAGGRAEPTVWEAALTDRYAFEFDAFVDETTDFTAAGVRLRDHYAFTPGIWYHLRYEVARTGADANGWYAATNLAGVATLKLNGRVIAKDVKVNGFGFANLAKESELRIDDVKVFALEDPKDYPAPPIPPKGGEKYTVGINVCNLWREGYHGGWECIDKGRGPKPVLGWYDEGIPEVADWEIKYMVEHGIDFQAVCWYSDVNAGAIRHPRLDDHLRDGFKNARYSDMMKYCLIWEMGSAGVPHDLENWKANFVPYLIEHHFKDPRYLKFDGKVVLAVFGAWLLADDYAFGSVENCRAAFDYLDEELKKIGFKGVEVVASQIGTMEKSDKWAKMGFTSGAAYGYGDDGSFRNNRSNNLVRATYPGLYGIPTASVGFDSMPWNARRWPMATPEDLERTLRWCREEYLPKYGKKGTWQEKTVWLSNWNEYGEGTYMMPVEGELGFKYLDAVRKTLTDASVSAATHVKPTATQKRRFNDTYCEAPRPRPQAWTRVLCRQPGRQIGWPTVIRRKSGEIWAVFSGDRDAHIDPYGKEQCVRSVEDGETWGKVETLIDEAVDNRDAGIVELPNTDLCLFSFGSSAYAQIGNRDYERHFERLKPADVKATLKPTCRRSGWAALDWEKPVAMKGSAPHGANVLKSGRLVSVGRTPAGGQALGCDARVKIPEPELLCEISDDGGTTWTVLSKIVPPEGYPVKDFWEPHVVEVADGTLVAQFRYHPNGRQVSPVLQCESADGGKTWTAIHPTGLTGLPPHLLRLRDGRLLTTYARRHPWDDPKPTGLGEFACVSSDNGRTWDVAHEIKIAGCVEEDMGYPSTCELDDGWMLTVYYQSPAPGEKPALMGTKWRLPADGRRGN